MLYPVQAFFTDSANVLSDFLLVTLQNHVLVSKAFHVFQQQGGGPRVSKIPARAPGAPTWNASVCRTPPSQTFPCPLFLGALKSGCHLQRPLTQARPQSLYGRSDTLRASIISRAGWTGAGCETRSGFSSAPASSSGARPPPTTLRNSRRPPRPKQQPKEYFRCAQPDAAAHKASTDQGLEKHMGQKHGGQQQLLTESVGQLRQLDRAACVVLRLRGGEGGGGGGEVLSVLWQDIKKQTIAMCKHKFDSSNKKQMRDVLKDRGNCYLDFPKKQLKLLRISENMW